MHNFSIGDSRTVCGEGECTYQCVLEDFKNAKFIGIMTFNISPKTDSFLLKSLKNACDDGTNAVIITNIPKRFPSYFSKKCAIVAKDMIDLYKRQLNPINYGMRLNPYFNFHNHAKVVMTDNIIYCGSGNFSDESNKNFECGTISTDKELIKYFKDSIFPDMQSRSISYFKYNFALAVANLENLIPACKAARQHLFDAAFEPWADYDTNFEEKWVYRTTDSEITIDFLREFVAFFSQFEDALEVIDDIIDEYWELDELPEQVEGLKHLLDEYRTTYDSFYENISYLFEELEQVAQYDLSVESCKKIVNEYGMEAYDENLDFYAEKAMNEASGEYEALIVDSEASVRNALESLDCMAKYFEQLKKSLYQLLEINSSIDNTDIYKIS